MNDGLRIVGLDQLDANERTLLCTDSAGLNVPGPCCCREGGGDAVGERGGGKREEGGGSPSVGDERLTGSLI